MAESNASLCVIEINDAGITVADSDGVKHSSPGYAVLEGGTLYTGAAGYEGARLNPRRTYDRFWSQLDQQPLGRAAGDAQSHADLAYFHLRDIWNAVSQESDNAVKGVIFAVPPDFGKPQLALLLGIAQSLEIPVAGLIASSVACAAAVAGGGPRLVLDIELHRTTATQVSGGHDGDNLQLGACRELNKQGLAGLYDAWADMIAERFVRETRYDPQHQATAEQNLYARLPQWLHALQGADHARFELQAGQRSHYVEISLAELQQAAAAIYRPIVEAAAKASNATILLSHHLAELPGLKQAINKQSATPVVTLPENAVAESVFAHHEAIRSDPAAPAFVTRLPGAVSGAVIPAETVQNSKINADTPPGIDTDGQPPSHVLYDWQAYPIHGAPLVLDSDPPRGLRLGEAPGGAVVTRRGGQAVLQVGNSKALKVNGAAVKDEITLAVGDAMQLGDAPEMRLIALVSGTSVDNG